ncbi:MAG: hypothetical protein HDR71_12190 [Lachnospiraceae bacterium]|nr:hypothetical protein [Lachnospiraceae bacterium]
MDKAIIHFSDKSTIELKEGDFIIPIVRVDSDEKTFASMDESVELWGHVHNGLIPSIMDAFLKCDFFYVNHDFDTAYNSKAIVKITIA